MVNRHLDCWHSKYFATEMFSGRGYNYTVKTFVPTYFRSRERKFHKWNFRSLELSLPRTFVPGSESDMELLLPGTFIPWNFRSHSQRNVVLLPNTNYDYLIVKLMVLRYYSLFVFLYSFIVVKDGRI